MATITMAISLVLAPICAAGLILASSRRLALILLLGVFVGVGAIIGLDQHVRIGMGLLVTGAMTCAILAFGFERVRWPEQGLGAAHVPSGRTFRAATVLLVGAAAWGIAVSYGPAIGGVPAPRTTAAVMIMSMGLLQLGLSQEQGAAALGLLTTLAGFEVFYVALEPSLALRAVLAGIMLGIALVSSVLLEPLDGVTEGRRVR